LVLIVFLLVVDAILLALAALLAFESFREQERRAPIFGLVGVAFHLGLGAVIIWLPAARTPLAVIFGLGILAGLAFLIRPRAGARSLKGALGYVAGEAARADEREIVFARNRSLRPRSAEFERYYRMHPQHKEYDEQRRRKGGPLGRPGAIDRGFRPNVAMLRSSFQLPHLLGPHAVVDPEKASQHDAYAEADTAPTEIDPAQATRIVKGWAKHLGADLVGVCRINPLWAYSRRGEIHYGNWEDWGEEIPEPLPFGVGVATAMEAGNIAAAPHTPTVVESGLGYARGAYITTVLAHWFGAMGFKAIAEHNRRYDLLMVPLAIDAGLGELGRQGYLIAPRFGPRVRLFAVQTDMPLIPDEPVGIGAERFCERCQKCALSCPSQSIPQGPKTVVRGIKRWKLNEETCFDYWSKVGTDCCVCMAVCPFSRPARSIHLLVKWLLRRSALAGIVFPHLDNIVYGQKWRPRPAPDWLDYPRE